MSTMNNNTNWTDTINLSSGTTTLTIPVGGTYVDKDIVLTINVEGGGEELDIETGTVTYSSGWKAGTDGMYLKKYGKVVHLVGCFTKSSGSTASTTGTPVTMATLPTGFRPTNDEYSIQQASGNGQWRLKITSAGEVGFSHYYSGTSAGTVGTSTNLWINATWFTD